MMIIKKILQFVLILGIILAVTLGVAYNKRADVLDYVAGKYYPEISIKVKNLETNQLHLVNISLQKSVSNYQLQARDLEIIVDYDIWQLLDGRVRKLQIIKGHVSVEQPKSPKKLIKKEDPSISLSQVLNELPVEEIVVSNLEVLVKFIPYLQNALQVSGSLNQERNVEIAVKSRKPSSSISAKYLAKNNKLVIKRAAIDILGGKILAKNVSLDIEKIKTKPVTAEVEFLGINLEELLLLHPQKVVKGTGKLTGRLPVVISSKGIEIDKGTLKALGGGELRYKSDVPVGENPQLELMTKALEHFIYEKLESTVTLNKSGDLEFGLHLEGKNPDFRKGQQINFNITLSENLFALYRSLELSGTIEEYVSKHFIKKDVRDKKVK